MLFFCSVSSHVLLSFYATGYGLMLCLGRRTNDTKTEGDRIDGVRSYESRHDINTTNFRDARILWDPWMSQQHENAVIL